MAVLCNLFGCAACGALYARAGIRRMSGDGWFDALFGAPQCCGCLEREHGSSLLIKARSNANSDQGSRTRGVSSIISTATPRALEESPQNLSHDAPQKSVRLSGDSGQDAARLRAEVRRLDTGLPLSCSVVHMLTRARPSSPCLT